MSLVYWYLGTLICIASTLYHYYLVRKGKQEGGEWSVYIIRAYFYTGFTALIIVLTILKTFDLV